jgi:hypothetical protein
VEIELTFPKVTLALSVSKTGVILSTLPVKTASERESLAQIGVLYSMQVQAKIFT